jgi:hypothetical protein
MAVKKFFPIINNPRHKVNSNDLCIIDLAVSDESHRKNKPVEATKTTQNNGTGAAKN